MIDAEKELSVYFDVLIPYPTMLMHKPSQLWLGLAKPSHMGRTILSMALSLQ